MAKIINEQITFTVEISGSEMTLIRKCLYEYGLQFSSQIGRCEAEALKALHDSLKTGD